MKMVVVVIAGRFAVVPVIDCYWKLAAIETETAEVVAMAMGRWGRTLHPHFGCYYCYYY